MTISRAIFTIHPMIRNTLLLVPLLGVLVLYFLQEGISIDSLKIGRFQIQGLYLKLDNKLVLKLDHLLIPQEKDKTPLGDIDQSLKRVKKVLNYFEYIELNSLEFTNNNYRIIYSDNIVYISNDEYEVAAYMVPLNGGMNIDIPLVYIKEYDLRLNGDATYSYSTGRVTFAGVYSIAGIDGNASLDISEQKLSFLISSKEANSISGLLDMFDIDNDTRVWIDKRVLAKKYKLISLRGGGRWDDSGFVLAIDELKGEALIRQVTIKFDKSLKPVKAKSAIIRYAKGRLDFDLKKPFYNKKALNGSKISLTELTGEKPTKILLKLKFDTKYDKEINNILKAYDITIPISQKKGKAKAEIMLDVELKSGKAKTEGRVYLSKGIVNIGSTPLPTYGGEVTFTSNRVALWNVDLYDSWYRGKANGFINLSTDRAKFKVELKKLQIGDKQGTNLSLKNIKKLAVTMDFKNRLKFTIPKLKLKINEQKGGGIEIVSSNIKPLLPYIKGLPLDITSGKFSVTTKDYKKYLFEGMAKWKHSYVYNKNGYISSVPFKGVFKNDRLTIRALKGKFVYDSGKSLISIQNINIDAKKMTTLYSSKKSKEISRLKVKGINSIIRYDKYVLLADKFDLSLRGKNTTFVASKDGDTVRLEKNGNSIVVHANKIKDKMLSALTNFGGMQGGRYSLELLGNIKGEMKGVIDIKGGAIKSFKAYNDLMALFNTIP
ncbi:MAG TPA: hypothetical protein EYG98_07080, partial [Sulfurovum sp.]|nr:hypothetical protein [Sulfurovum sp.]